MERTNPEKTLNQQIMSERTLYHYNGNPNEYSSIRDNNHMTVARNLHHEDAREIVKRWNHYIELQNKVKELEEVLGSVEWVLQGTVNANRNTTADDHVLLKIRAILNKK